MTGRAAFGPRAFFDAANEGGGIKRSARGAPRTGAPRALAKAEAEGISLRLTFSLH